VWYAAFYRPFAPSIQQAMSFYSAQQIPRSAGAVLKNLQRLPFFSYFSVTPVELLFSTLFVGAAFWLWFSNRRRLLPIDLFFLTWFLAHFVMFAALNYRPVRYYLPIVPPMIALAVRGIFLIGCRSSIRVPQRSSPGIAAAVPLARHLAHVSS
jgi:4-amino-4-deoxy-L-arabinose transferase-like glycosyltransferase